MRTTNIKFTGLASGLDTESMVQAMVMPYKMKVDSVTQQQKLLEIKKDAWKELNTKLLNFHTKTLNQLRLESTFNKTKVTVSNSGSIQMDSSASVPEGNHTIKVESVASGATVSSQSIKDKLTEGSKDKTTLSSLGIQDGTVLTVTTGEGTPVTVTVGKITVDGTAQEMTLADLEKQLSTQLSERGFNCKFDEGVGAFVMSSKSTGDKQTIKLESSDGNDTLKQLGFISSKDDLGQETGIYEYAGTSAKIIYNGGIVVESQTNAIEVNGLKFTVTGKSSETITISSVQDTEIIVDFVKTFVDEYNKLIEDMEKLVSAKKNKDYLPLTKEQKEGMTDEEIKLWEEKVKGSVLSNDPTIKSMISSMRSILGGVVEGNAFGTLSEIGISTGNWQDKGKLYIDENKLRKALDKDKDAVINLIAGQGSAREAYEKKNGEGSWGALTVEQQKSYEESTKAQRLGIGDRLYNALNEKTKGTQDKSVNSFYNDKALQKQIDNYNKELAKQEEKMYRMEDLYYKKFAAMEKMLNQLNTQSGALMQQLGGM